MAERTPVLLVVQQDPDGGLGRLEVALREVADLDVRRPDRGDDLPADLAGYAGLVVLGGVMGATDDDVAPWLPATRHLLAAGVEDQVPTVGICLGAQLLAVATGGRVERGAAGLEVGVVPMALRAAARRDPLLGVVAARSGTDPAVPHFHRDAVTVLPPGAVLLATGERYPHQAYRLGDCAWGLQYHPEVTAADFAGWLRDGHGAVAEAGLHAPDLAARYAALEPQLAVLAQAHADAIAALVAGAGRRAPGYRGRDGEAGCLPVPPPS
ncbi:MAG TPA: type 1 glutamine amidotransferase [Kineosporiaceae bacterium]